MSRLSIRKVAVLGAGVMGAQIAAHLANANVPVLLFDLPGKDGKGSEIARRAIDGLKKLEPAPLATRDRVHYLEPANYADDLHRLAECDLVIEAIAERMDWKTALFRQVAPHLAPHALFATNTSGLSIQALADAVPENLRSRFCGIHFFNPPRYMKLVELIPTAATAPQLMDALETWLVTRLGKGVVRAFDTPNFIANRLGVFAILSAFHHTARLGLGLDEVDALTGTLIGRPKSATYRTADVVGLDTLAHVVRTLHDTLPQDPWHGHFHIPAWMQGLIDGGRLGQKTRGGIYRREGKQNYVFDPKLSDYRPADREVAPEVLAMLKIKDSATRFTALRASHHPQAQFLWAIHRDIFHYTAFHLADIADNGRDADLALRWGFGWSQGPLEIWQAAGWAGIAKEIAKDILAAQTLAAAPLPAWVFQRAGVHSVEGAYSPREDRVVPRSALPVYTRQLFPERLPGEASPAGETLWETEALRLWTLPAVDGGIAIISFKTRMHALNRALTGALQEAIQRVEREYDGLVIWHEAPFAVGADLKEVLALLEGEESKAESLDGFVRDFQRTSQAIKFAQVPVVAAVQGMALGGGCEFALHAAHRVVALESQIGLVEAGVGLLPAGGGCKEFALRAQAIAAAQQFGEAHGATYQAFQTIANAKLARNALDAQAMGFVQASDTVLFNPAELLYVALRQARALAESAWRPPLPARRIAVPGKAGIATLEMQLVNLHGGGYISAHDYRVARATAVALCGGEVDGGTLVDEAWLLDVERQQFLDLLATPQTRERIRHMLDTGKPLRN